MTNIRAWLAGVCAATALAALTALAATPPAAAAERSSAAGRVTLRAGLSGPPSLVRPEAEPEGPPACRRDVPGYLQRLQRAGPSRVRACGRPVGPADRSPVPITVSATFEPLGAGILGSAGPGLIWRNFPGAAQPNTWYADALANKLSGGQLDPAPDILASFNSSFSNWHFGSGPAPAGRFDFTSVVLHELGHGLGFLGAGDVFGSVGTVRLIGSPLIYDRFTENGSGLGLLQDFPDNSAALARQLQGNRLFFDSAQVRAANRNYRAKLYAPPTFDAGSSYSHLDETLYGRGDQNSLMTPFLGRGETIRQPGPITLAILETLGW